MTIRIPLIDLDGAAANRRRVRAMRVAAVQPPRQPDASRGGRYGDRPVGGGKPREAMPLQNFPDLNNNRADDAGAEEEIDNI